MLYHRNGPAHAQDRPRVTHTILASPSACAYPSPLSRLIAWWAQIVRAVCVRAAGSSLPWSRRSTDVAPPTFPPFSPALHNRGCAGL